MSQMTWQERYGYPVWVPWMFVALCLGFVGSIIWAIYLISGWVLVVAFGWFG